MSGSEDGSKMLVTDKSGLSEDQCLKGYHFFNDEGRQISWRGIGDRYHKQSFHDYWTKQLCVACPHCTAGSKPIPDEEYEARMVRCLE